MEKRPRKENSRSEIIERENSGFREHHPMPIIGIPGVVVAEAVDIDLELTIVIDIGIGNKEIRASRIL